MLLFKSCSYDVDLQYIGMRVVQNSNYYMNRIALLTDVRTSIVYDSLRILFLCCAVCDSGVNLLLVSPKHIVRLTLLICARFLSCKMNYVSFHGTSNFKLSGLSSEGIVHHEYAAQDWTVYRRCYFKVLRLVQLPVNYQLKVSIVRSKFIATPQRHTRPNLCRNTSPNITFHGCAKSRTARLHKNSSYFPKLRSP
jgi:hypothetical protein